MPKVSILIATYNRAGLLRNAIESILAQTYSDYELIVVDDGSSDGTRSVMQTYIDHATSFPNQIRYVYQEHQGKSVALNKGLALARGQWIGFLDSDDIWHPNKLEMQFEAIAQFPECEACFTDCRFSGNAKMDTSFFRHFGWSCRTRLGKIDNAAEFVLRFPCASIITVLFRANLLQKVGEFDPILRFTEDYDFVFRLGLETQFCFVNLPLATADRSDGRHTGTTKVWDDVRFRLECEQYRLDKWLRLGISLPRVVRKGVKRNLSAIHSAWANHYLEQRDYESALREMVVAMEHNLSPGLLGKWMLTRLCPKTISALTVKRRLGESYPE